MLRRPSRPASTADAGATATPDAAALGADRRATSAFQRGAPSRALGRWPVDLAPNRGSGRFADDLAQRPGADRGQLVADILGQCRHELFDLLRRARNLARRSSRCVAIPVGQVSRWHCRAMSQPSATRMAVPKPNSSAPSSAAMTMSRPLRRPPSVRRVARSRRPRAGAPDGPPPGRAPMARRRA